MADQAFYGYLTISMIFLAAVTFAVLHYIDAPYGRFTRPGWGPVVNSRAGWVIMEAPACLIFAFLFARYVQPGVAVWCFFLMWEIHYFHRAFIYPFTRRSSRKMPLVIMLMAILFNTINAYLNAMHFAFNAEQYHQNYLLSWNFQLGLGLFTLGFAITKVADAELRRLRRTPGEDYKIPRGYLFRYVSCPNYLGEIVQWCGWALAAWSTAGLIFAIWTFANLFPRARSHHKWYRANFQAYPEARKAIIPFVY